MDAREVLGPRTAKPGEGWRKVEPATFFASDPEVLLPRCHMGPPWASGGHHHFAFGAVGVDVGHLHRAFRGTPGWKALPATACRRCQVRKRRSGLARREGSSALLLGFSPGFTAQPEPSCGRTTPAS